MIFAIAILLVPCALLVNYVYSAFRNYERMQRVSSSIPEQKCTPLIGQFARLLDLDNVTNHVYNDFKKYGSPTKAWLLNVLLINLSDPRQIQIVLNSPYSAEKPNQYKFGNDYTCDGLITASTERWKITRKLLNPTFHQKILENFVRSFDERSKILVTNLTTEIGNSFFDISKYISQNMTDIFCETIIGGNVEEEHSECHLYELISKYESALLTRSLRPWLYRNAFFKLSNTKREHDEAGNAIHAFLREILNSKREEIKQSYTKEEMLDRRKSFLEKLLEVSEKHGIYTEKQLLGELVTMFVAGTDTTTAVVGYTLLLLGSHKEIQDRLFEEIYSVMDASDRPLTYRNLQQMCFLDRTVKEAMRLFPPVPFFARLITRDLDIGNHVLPRDAVCFIGPYTLHRNQEFWPKPEIFNPDRFLPEEVAKRHAYAYLPFAGGPRSCIGKGYAMLVIKTMIANILRSYIISSNCNVSEMKIRTEVVAKVIGGFKVKLEVRN